MRDKNCLFVSGKRIFRCNSFGITQINMHLICSKVIAFNKSRLECTVSPQ